MQMQKKEFVMALNYSQYHRVIILLSLFSIISNQSFSSNFEDNRIAQGPFDTTFSLNKNAKISIKGIVEQTGEIYLEYVKYEKKIIDYKQWMTISLFGELADKESIKFYAYGLEQDGDGKTSIKMRAVDPLSKIREMVLVDGKAPRMWLNNSKEAPTQQDWICNVKIEGEDVNIRIEKNYGGTLIKQGDEIEFPTNTLRLGYVIMNGDPLNYVEVYGVDSVDVRIGRVVGNFRDEKYEYKDTTLYAVMITKATVGKGDSSYTNTDLILNNGPVQNADYTINSIGYREEYRMPVSLVKVNGQANTQKGTYFLNHYKKIAYVRIRGSVKDQQEYKANTIQSIYHYDKEYQRAAEWIFQPDTSTQKILAFTVCYNRENHRVFFEEGNLKRAELINGGNYRAIGYTKDTLDKNEFKIKVVRAGDPDKSDSLCIWDMKPENLEKLASFELNKKEYEINTDTIVQSNIEHITKYRRNIEIYPNPATGQITIDFDEVQNSTRDLYLYDGQGRMLSKITLPAGDDRMRIDMSQMPQGEYYITDKKGGLPLILIR